MKTEKFTFTITDSDKKDLTPKEVEKLIKSIKSSLNSDSATPYLNYTIDKNSSIMLSKKDLEILKIKASHLGYEVKPLTK